jgi:hypothetical protein
MLYLLGSKERYVLPTPQVRIEELQLPPAQGPAVCFLGLRKCPAARHRAVMPV